MGDFVSILELSYYWNNLFKIIIDVEFRTKYWKQNSFRRENSFRRSEVSTTDYFD